MEKWFEKKLQSTYTIEDWFASKAIIQQFPHVTNDLLKGVYLRKETKTTNGELLISKLEPITINLAEAFLKLFEEVESDEQQYIKFERAISSKSINTIFADIYYVLQQNGKVEIDNKKLLNGMKAIIQLGGGGTDLPIELKKENITQVEKNRILNTLYNIGALAGDVQQCKILNDSLNRLFTNCVTNLSSSQYTLSEPLTIERQQVLKRGYVLAFLYFHEVKNHDFEFFLSYEDKIALRYLFETENDYTIMLHNIPEDYRLSIPLIAEFIEKNAVPIIIICQKCWEKWLLFKL
ncbi:hypothetical protein ACQKMV_07740 [Lysinibacillus sp. NPDC094403]|uniref:hypothetical protein n=1 Tax=Lysinibacillus sp. NPDC094403 TaxID=3390581 RepID=UPI003CFCABC3